MIYDLTQGKAMQPNYKLFDFQQFVRNLRLPYKRKERPDDTLKKLLDSITDDMTIEDMTFYKEYLSKFDVAKAIEGYQLVINPEPKATHDDYLMLLRLICASFSTADFIALFDEEHKTVEFTFKFGNESRSVVRKLQDISNSHIILLMDVFVKEQFKMEAKRMESDASRDEVDTERGVVLIYFETKMEKSCNHDTTCNIEGFANLND